MPLHMTMGAVTHPKTPIRDQCQGDPAIAAEDGTRRTAVILGERYELHGPQGDEQQLLRRARKVILLTYRKGFHIELPRHYSVTRRTHYSWIPNFGRNDVVTSDSNWGCAVRSTQMALAECLQTLAAGKTADNWDRKTIVRMFHDTSDSTFSIHNMVKADVEIGACVRPLQFGCASSAMCASHIIDKQNLINLGSTAFPDGVVYTKEVERAFQRNRSLIMWVTIQKPMNSQEEGCIRRLFGTQWLKGIVGADHSSPKAYYFIGYDADSLLYLDPHVTCSHKLDDSSDPSELQCHKLHRMKWDQLGLAATFCFLFEELEDFETFLRATTSLHLRSLPFEIVMAHAPPSHLS